MRNPIQIGGFGVGLTVFADILVGGPITGASMNPARSFGPALLSGFLDYHWLYYNRRADCRQSVFLYGCRSGGTLSD